MWELLYETFWDRLEHFCFNLCRDEARAEDLTQEVFLRALQNRSLINSFTERQCKAWLFTTARNLYCDQLRRAAKEEQLLSTFFPEEDRAEPDFALDTVEAASLLALLTPEERRLFTLRYTARSVSCSVSRPARSAAALPRYAIASKLNLRRNK